MADRCILCDRPAERTRLTSTDERITVLVCEACRREVPSRHTASDFAPPAATPAAAPQTTCETCNQPTPASALVAGVCGSCWPAIERGCDRESKERPRYQAPEKGEW